MGRIVSVDREKQEVVLSEAVSQTGKRKAETLALRTDARTALTRGKTPVTFDALAPGDQVVARYLATPGAPRALSIRLADAVRTPVPKTGTPPPSPP